MRLPIAAALALAACSGPTPDQPAVAPTAEPAASPTPVATATVEPAAPAKRAADYAGRWNGVEGMYLQVNSLHAGGVLLEMQYDLDHKGMFEGTVVPEGIRFTRDGASELLRPSDGDATGLKYLAGKKDCLTVKPGEGYCRG